MADRDDDEPLSHPHDKRVLAVIRAVLLENRWPSAEAELEDGVGTVVLRSWASTPHPTTVGGWKALCRKIAKEAAIDRTRSEMTGGKDSVKPTDRADEHPAANSGDTMDAEVDRKKALVEIAALLTPEERPVFEKLMLGHSKAEIARALKMKPLEVSRQVSTMRKRFRKALAPVGLMAVLALGGAYFLFRDRLGPDDQAHNQLPSPSSVPSVAPPGPSPEQLAQRAKADGLRKLASGDCAARKWKDCNEDLNEASKLDPWAEQTRAVQRLRNKVGRGMAQQELESKEVPGTARSLQPEKRPKLVDAIAASSGQSLRLVCARGAEPAHLCDQLAAAITSAGWNVTRETLATTDGGAVAHGLLIEVASDADDATQGAADALASGMERGLLLARGPDDMAAGGGVTLRLTVFAR